VDFVGLNGCIDVKAPSILCIMEQCYDNATEETGEQPLVVIEVTRLMRAKTSRNIPPGLAVGEFPEDAVKDEALVQGRATRSRL